ncbi:MAG: hypothetical protein R2756_03325 [Bacteroidales bacterium]
MTPGQQLKDASFTLEMTGPIPVTISSSITNYSRKLLMPEKVTTPAGTFDCVKVSYDTFSKMAFIKTEGRTVEWYAPNIGIVRSEYYDRKDKITSIHELSYVKIRY